MAEIDRIVEAIDLSKPEGHRNKAIIETLYGCGLRVSELVNLRLTDIHYGEGFVSVTGKGNKQRLVPISNKALKEIDLYRIDRNRLSVIHDENIVFLNRRGKKADKSHDFHYHKGSCREGRYYQKDQSPYLPPLICHSYDRSRC